MHVPIGSMGLLYWPTFTIPKSIKCTPGAPFWPLFLKVNPFSNQSKGHLGSRSIPSPMDPCIKKTQSSYFFLPSSTTLPSPPLLHRGSPTPCELLSRHWQKPAKTADPEGLSINGPEAGAVMFRGGGPVTSRFANANWSDMGEEVMTRYTPSAHHPDVQWCQDFVGISRYNKFVSHYSL